MRVLNRYRDGTPPGSVYIGRPSPYGNPYQIGQHGTREEVIAKHMLWARARLGGDPDWLRPLHGRDLLCFCKPAACHGDNYVLLCEELYGD